MRRLWSVHSTRLEPALNLAAELMKNAGYLPQIKERGIVRWEDREGVIHHCEIYFRSHRGASGTGYISMHDCNCDDRWVFKEIVRTFEQQLSQRGWLESFQGHIINSSGLL